VLDALVVGCGPVGALTAVRLATAGLSVLVVDREPASFPLPRAVAADGEVLELLERAVPGSAEGFLRDPPVRFLSAGGEELGRLRFPVPGLAFYRQPVLEERLCAALARLGVEVRRGVGLTGLEQSPDAVTASLTAAHPPDVRVLAHDPGLAERTQRVEARWVIGADGASSTVRRLVGAGWRGRDLPHRWLVCDVVGEPVPGRRLVTYTCDPARPQVDMPLPGGHRWEWLLRDGGPDGDPGGDGGPGGRAARATELLRRDTDAAVEVVRAVDYRFSARRAGTWRAGRVLLAGDAAHTMPPFAGQGMGAGLRDAWALGALLPAAAEPSALDRYQRLREPHLRRMTALSLLLGTLLQAPRAAGGRDLLLRRAFRAPVVGPWLARGGPRPERSGVLDL
jgi:3-(3-hydroxy-phenyl)propionate hydroxylase